MNPWDGITLAWLGLAAGSFINMLVYRTAILYKIEDLPAGRQVKNISRQQYYSFCDYCGRRLSWQENIPLLSWLILGGKSRCCGKKLNTQYPLVEAGTALIFMVAGSRLGLSLEEPDWRLGIMAILSLIIVTLLVFSAVFDVRYQILPDFSTGMIMLLAGLLAWLAGKNLVEVMAAAVGATAFMALLYLITKGRGMGLGDVKYAAAMGLLLGWPGVVVANYLAFVSGAVLGLALMAAGKAKRNSAIAFGPFLIGGTMITWWWGEEIVNMMIKIL